jgi:large subunit ribosomal protein L25
MSDQLSAQMRTKVGSRPSKYLRMQGRIPCSIQGEGQANVDVSIDAADFARARREHVHLFDIAIDGGSTEPVMVREIQWNAMGDSINHIEWLRVVRGQKTEAEVDLEFIGHSAGGVLTHSLTRITISCLPSEIPDSIEAKVEGMEPGDTLHISDIVLPEGAEHVMDPGITVATVSVVRATASADDEAAEGEGADAAGDS